MTNQLTDMTAAKAIEALANGEVSPLELVDAAAARIEQVEPDINALPTLCLERARAHALDIMAEKRCEGKTERGWLGGLPVAIKDLTDVAGVRTTYGSPIFKDHVPATSHSVVQRIERAGGIVIAKSNTPEFGAGGSTFNEVFGRTRNPWNTSLTSGGSTGGGAAALAAGEVWLAQGTDHGGSTRRPATYCSVVGMRPSPGRITRGTVKNLFSPLSVQGPMARNIPDLARFLDSMAGLCPLDPLTFDAPAVSFAQAADRAQMPARIAVSPDFNGQIPMDTETRELVFKAASAFQCASTVVEEASPDLGDIENTFLTLRSQQFVVDRELQIADRPDDFKPDIIWNTERGLKQSTSQLAAGERARSRLYDDAQKFFRIHDFLITAGASTPAFDVNLRAPAAIDGKKLEHYLGASMITASVSVMGLPAVSMPCGFDQFGRPVGIQIVGPHRSEAMLLSAAHAFEQILGLDQQLPIDPRQGVVPETTVA